MQAPATPTIYFVDTCSFTELRRIYPRRQFRAVWELVERLIEERRLLSVEDVLLELQAQDDELTDWAESHEEMFQPLTPEVQDAAREILRTSPTLIDLKKKKSSADPFLIAAAQTRGATVVTQEKRSGGPHAAKIPDVCLRLRVRCISLLVMLADEGLT